MRNSKNYAATVFLSFLISFSAILLSCGGPPEPKKLLVGNNFYYWEATEDSNYGDAIINMKNFKKLEDLSEHNLMHTFGKDRHYVWIRTEFEIPDDIKNQPLGLVFPHLRFAAQTYCNGAFIAQYGNFPPREQSNLFSAHFFSLPLSILKQDGKNIILMKIFIQGDSGISSHAYIHPMRYAYSATEKLNFKTSKIYMLLFGIMFFTFILYLCLYLSLKDFKEYLYFALMNLATSFFLIYFFATEIPVYSTGQFPFLLLAKFTLCIPGYTAIYLTTIFSRNYFGGTSPLIIKIVRLAILAVQVLPTLFAPTYSFLVKASPFMISLLGIQVGLGVYELVKHIVLKKTRREAIELLLGFMPFIIGIIIDVSLRNYDNTQSYPYFMIFGWQGSIVAFIVLLAKRFQKVYRKNERLSNHLLEEVANRTHELEDANYELSLLNERLEKEKHRSDMDLEMASVVQRKFLPQPNKLFRGWEISICYSPQAKVSGDFYDYYSYDNTLNGISLFDVSGHGLSASLITMLSKNIIARVFQTAFRRKESVDKILNKINNMILNEKGDVENYMTGILCSFDDSENPAKCKVELGNAGHPYPLKYSVQDNEIFELKGNDGKPHYGAIGMQGISVSFARSNFLMQTGDILVLYTDGLTEALNTKQEQFGLSAIKEIIKNNHAKSSGEILGLIIDKLNEFTEYRGIDDDLTVIIAKRKNVSEYVAEEEKDEDFDDTIEELDEVEEAEELEDSEGSKSISEE